MAVVATTVKGWGAAVMQGGGWHGTPVTGEKLEQAHSELNATGVGLTSALAGYEKNRLNGLERLARALAGIAILVPDMTIAGPGLAAAAALIVGHRFLKGDRSPVDIPSN